jgi:uncharacterized protein YhbP (UPF0306 family)
MVRTPNRLRQLETLAALLRRENTLALATADERGEVSVAPLFFVADERLSLFWLSSATCQHSQNLKKTSRAAATVHSHTESWKDICGVQMRGNVTMIADRMRRRLVIKRYAERFKLGPLFVQAIRQFRLYEFRPEFFRFIDNSKGFGYKFELIPAESDPAVL